MYCPYCKTTILETDSFCPSCGKSTINAKNKSEFSCTECGSNVPADAKYCWNCGALLEITEFICSECGKAVPADAAFCNNCGAPLDSTVQSSNPKSAEEKPQLKFKTMKANKKIAEENHCKICGRKFSIGDDVNQCENCHSFYHSVCWNNAGGCTQPTCKEETKKCPFCGEEIKKSALKCRFCGNYLDASLRDRQVPKGKLKDASTALTMAIIGIFCFGIILGPMAISKGNKALKQIDSEPGWEGRGSAQAAVIIGWIDVVFFIIFIIIRISSI